MTMKVTIFGPVSAGKSTLAGLFIYQRDPDKAEREIARTRHKLGLIFTDVHALAYLVDVSDDERKRQADRVSKENPGEQTTKRLHVLEGEIADGQLIDVIDTPGGWDFAKNQRLRGLYYADVGIYMIECRDLKDVAEDAQLTDLLFESFASLITWAALRPNAPLIVLIAKMDQDAFDRAAFDASVAHIKRALGNRLTPQFIPVSIDVKGRTSHNITSTENSPMSWYGGPSLCTHLSSLQGRVEPQTSEPVMVITRQAVRGRGTIYFGKVVSGSFSRGDKILIDPLRLRSGNTSSVTARISYLERSSNQIEVDILQSGDLGGVIFGQTSSQDFSVTDSTIIIAENAPFMDGRYLRLSIATFSAAAWIRLSAHLSILYFGRYYTVKICEISVHGDSVKIGGLIITDAGLVVPQTQRHSILFPSVVISPTPDALDFLEAEIISVGNVIGVSIGNPKDFSRITNRLKNTPLSFVDNIIYGDNDILDAVLQVFKSKSKFTADQPPRFSIIDTSMPEGAINAFRAIEV